MAELHNIFKSCFLAMNHHCLLDCLLSLAFVFQVLMKWKKVWHQSFLQLCRQTLQCPPSGAEKKNLLQLFTGNSRFTCLQVSDCISIHLFVFLSVFLVVYHLVQTLPQYEHGFSMNFSALYKLTIIIIVKVLSDYKNDDHP